MRQFLHARPAQRFLVWQRRHLVRSGGVHEAPPGERQPIVFVEQSMPNAANRDVGGHEAKCDDFFGQGDDRSVAAVQNKVEI